MRRHNVQIDREHSRAICLKVGERLRESLAAESPELPESLRLQLDRLRRLDDDDASPASVNHRRGK